MPPPAFDPEAFVVELYAALLGRAPDPAGLADRLHALRTGRATPGALVAEVARSDEFARRAADARLLNEATQYGELQLLLGRWLDETAVARFVVDVGARGRERSNAYDLCRWFGWRALLVEANPALMAGLRADFAGLDVEVVGCAVSDRNGRATLTLGVNDDVSSLNPDLARHWGPARGEVEVEVRRLPELLAERGAPARFDLLSIDIEGEDIRVLNDVVADGRFAPTWIYVEASHNFATRRLEDVGASAQACAAYAIVGQTPANLLLRRRPEAAPPAAR